MPDAVACVRLERVDMTFVVPKPLRHYVLKPFQPGRRVVALRGVEMSAKVGDRIALFGVNGAGKTTVLKLISGLIFPTAGRVLIHGRSVEEHQRHVRREVGYVINEERSFYWRLTGFQNLEFFAGLENAFGVATHERIWQLLTQVGLSQDANRRVAEYSAGMKQRLALARGLLTSPSVMLLDEPTRSLDPVGAATIHGLLRQTLGADQAVVVATNDFEDALALCDRLLVLKSGAIVASMAIGKSDRVEHIATFVRDQLSMRTHDNEC